MNFNANRNGIIATMKNGKNRATGELFTTHKTASPIHCTKVYTFIFQVGTFFTYDKVVMPMYRNTPNNTG
eukprot:12892.XXX_68291_68569_1 [CDS] Oithona nana genome sequencing.